MLVKLARRKQLRRERWGKDEGSDPSMPGRPDPEVGLDLENLLQRLTDDRVPHTELDGEDRNPDHEGLHPLRAEHEDILNLVEIGE